MRFRDLRLFLRIGTLGLGVLDFASCFQGMKEWALEVILCSFEARIFAEVQGMGFRAWDPELIGLIVVSVGFGI